LIPLIIVFFVRHNGGDGAIHREGKGEGARVSGPILGGGGDRMGWNHDCSEKAAAVARL
jgi:hypothetical protein